MAFINVFINDLKYVTDIFEIINFSDTFFELVLKNIYRHIDKNLKRCTILKAQYIHIHMCFELI